MNEESCKQQAEFNSCNEYSNAPDLRGALGQLAKLTALIKVTPRRHQPTAKPKTMSTVTEGKSR